MYRTTGDEKYVYSILFDVLLLSQQLRADASRLHDSQYINGRVDGIINNLSEETRKSSERREVLARQGELIWQLDLLSLCYWLQEYGLDQGPDRDNFLTVLDYLRTVEFAKALMDSQLLRVYSPQVANYIYYLSALNISDLRERYNTAFRDVFPDSLDDELTSDEFEDKIYGLTHIIIAASGYYQFGVSGEQYRWILRYFEENIDAIISEARPDVIAEVGICFLLAGEAESLAFDKCRHRMTSLFDEKECMILSETGSSDLNSGEHRNVLTYMLLNFPRRLHTGPDLLKSDKCLHLLRVLSPDTTSN